MVPPIHDHPVRPLSGWPCVPACSTVHGPTSVAVGIASAEYNSWVLRRNPMPASAYSATGGALSVACGRCARGTAARMVECCLHAWFSIDCTQRPRGCRGTCILRALKKDAASRGFDEGAAPKVGLGLAPSTPIQGNLPEPVIVWGQLSVCAEQDPLVRMCASMGA